MKSIALAVVLTAASAAPSFAASCSSWKATCDKRGGGDYCSTQFSQCLSTGTWTEGAKFGGAKHSGLTKK
jgi:hypothetical protein